MPVVGASLYVRRQGSGPTIVVVHGGPDFDSAYLHPHVDRLARSFHVVTYDQRGRGRSRDGVQPEQVSMASEVEDLDAVRRSLGAPRIAVLGHSWGGIVALEYALRRPRHVSHLVLVNTAPACHDDFAHFRRSLAATRTPEERAAIVAARESDEFRAGDVAADVAYHRIHFRPAVAEPAALDVVLDTLRAVATRGGIVLARAIEARLLSETVMSPGYDLLPELERLDVPTLVVHGDHDFVPVECAERIARAVPGARFLLLEDCGHFAYLEAAERLERALIDFFAVG